MDDATERNKGYDLRELRVNLERLLNYHYCPFQLFNDIDAFAFFSSKYLLIWTLYRIVMRRLIPIFVLRKIAASAELIKFNVSLYTFD